MSNPAETYEREWVPGLFEPWALALLDFADVRGAVRLLDVACGTGIVARRAAQRLAGQAHVAGIDLNPKMIAVARAATEREKLSVTYREGSAESLPFGDAEFDLLTCQQGLQFVADRQRAVVEMHRVLAGGGRLALALWLGLDRHPLMGEMNEVIHRHLGVPALAMPFSLCDPAGIRALLENAGFSDIEMTSQTKVARLPAADRFAALQIDIIAAAIPAVQSMDDAARANLISAAHDEMTGIVSKAAQADHVAMPMTSWLVSAQRR
jgi:ubiquinone/menaquinone biosynthesis C-methylase UbiE